MRKSPMVRPICAACMSEALCRDNVLYPFRHVERGSAYVIKLRQHVGDLLAGHVYHPAAMLVESMGGSNAGFVIGSIT